MTKEMSVGAIERMCHVDRKIRILQDDMKRCIANYLPEGTKLTVHCRQVNKTVMGEVQTHPTYCAVGIKVLEVDGEAYPFNGKDLLIVRPFNVGEYELIKIGD